MGAHRVRCAHGPVGRLVLSNAGILPFASPAYDFVNDHFILVAIPLLLFKADLRVILRQGGRVLAGFMVSAAGVVAGPASRSP